MVLEQLKLNVQKQTDDQPGKVEFKFGTKDGPQKRDR
jgi:hypothetical protein